MALIRLDESNQGAFLPEILALESLSEYPLGEDFFRIDHGRDYFAFFRRLGEPRFYAWIEKGKLVALSATVLRRIPSKNGKQKAWYLCDLKIHPDFRGRHIPIRMMTSAFPGAYSECRRAYAISMDPADGSPNRVARLLARFPLAPLKVTTKLHLFNLDEQKMRQALPSLERHRGPVGFLSLTGVKDIVLRSSGSPIPLLHVQFGPLTCPGESLGPAPDHQHMFFIPESDPLLNELRFNQILPCSSATVIAHRMQPFDWKWILSSDV